MSSSSPPAGRRSSGPLRGCLIALAGTPDDQPTITDDLTLIARLAADQIAAVSYASVTCHAKDGFSTVAASSELAVAVDRAQYSADAGPCLSALTGGEPVPVPDIGATMNWPGFRDIAGELGLQGSLSVPLFAGRGTPLAALNLYAHDATHLRHLSAAVVSVFDAATSERAGSDGLDAGSHDLVAGLAEAFAVRAVIQQAIGVVMAMTGHSVETAYATVRLRAVESGVALNEAAARVVGGWRW
jgi:hypothetical protein